MNNSYQLKLKGHYFQELFRSSGLVKLDQDFLNYLKTQRPDLHTHLLFYRQNPKYANEEQISQLLIEVAQMIEAFISQLFGIEQASLNLQMQTLSHNPIFAFKAYYVMRLARRQSLKNIQMSFNELNQIFKEELSSNGLDNHDLELAISQLGQFYLQAPEKHQIKIEQLVQWCYLAMNSSEGRDFVKNWQMFKLPKPLNFKNLVPFRIVPEDPYGRYQGADLVPREGFDLTDSRMNQRQAMDEVAYCVYCHKNQGDFCSRGFPVKKNDLKQGLKINPAGDTLTGCPLEERISEMHVLKRDGFGIGALAMVMRDNPMCPVTGHRICNDCMKACIYQKQDPVNIPQTETRILTDVLDLPWGVEIYDLLTRWNPLRPEQWLIKPYNGLKVLVMGMGPSGFSLAHHLLMEGFSVVGMDGLKIEPLANLDLQQPVYSYQQLKENLSDRLITGFGGVAEYGITVRWDKNFLKLIYLSLLRRPYFQIFGCVRFGGTLEVEDAWALGFDHLALAVGAGLPKELNIPNSLAPGMRQANDFLMSLQLTGAGKATSLANLQVRWS
ncbi:MAG: pyridine nucleotide-disulfide oxidoreductase, partial [Proteobacteria bacterium]|nr:pyridine nucleotide-disulfide oxidoreductase [Pseudomonadota bacterium]